METSKQVLALLSFFLIVSFCDVFAKPTCAAPKNLSDLNRSMHALSWASRFTGKSMDWLRKDKGYANHVAKTYNCVLPTHLLYSSSSFRFYNATTLKQHLKKIASTLFPLFNATNTDNFSKEAKNITLKSDLADLQANIIKSVYYLSLMGYKDTSKFSYDSSKLTKDVKAYMKCAGFKVTPDGVRFMRVATLVESVKNALFDLTDGVIFIEECLDTRN